MDSCSLTSLQNFDRAVQFNVISDLLWAERKEGDGKELESLTFNLGVRRISKWESVFDW